MAERTQKNEVFENVAAAGLGIGVFLAFIGAMVGISYGAMWLDQDDVEAAHGNRYQHNVEDLIAADFDGETEAYMFEGFLFNPGSQVLEIVGRSGPGILANNDMHVGLAVGDPVKGILVDGLDEQLTGIGDPTVDWFAFQSDTFLNDGRTITFVPAENVIDANGTPISEFANVIYDAESGNPLPTKTVAPELSAHSTSSNSLRLE